MLKMQEMDAPSQWVHDHRDDVLICLLGTFRLLRHGRPLDALIAGKAITLLQSRPARETGVPRGELQELLWPDQLRQINRLCRSTASSTACTAGCEVHFPTRTIVYRNGSYALNHVAGVTTDVARFDELTAEGHRLAAAGRDRRRLSASRARSPCTAAIWRPALTCTP